MSDRAIRFILIFLAIFALVLSVVAVREIFFKNTTPSTNVAKIISDTNSINVTGSQNKRLETTILEVKSVQVIDKHSIATEIEDFINSKKFKSTKDENFTISSCPLKNIKIFKIKQIDKNSTKIAIIMDDIGNIHQVDKLLALNMKITPSIFPRTSTHPDTPKYAKKFPCYMVHTPMEAYNFVNPEEMTLNVGDSISVIEKRLKEIKKEFPYLVAINNHTGSKFTSDSRAMDRLFCVLDKLGIFFIDSRTSVHTKVRSIAKLHHRESLERDTFLDNKPNVGYIKNQIKKSIKKAKKKGLSIAICHPRRETFEALKEAKSEGIFDGVELVYVDNLIQ